MSKKVIKPKEYKEVEIPLSIVSEDVGVYGIMNMMRQGISFSAFIQVVEESLLNMQEWSKILHIDARTLQRYKVSNLTFAPLQSEKIIEIKLLNQAGVSVFGDMSRFHTWLNTNNIAMGGTPPKDLLDNAFGIAAIKDELLRIQYGVLA